MDAPRGCTANAVQPDEPGRSRADGRVCPHWVCAHVCRVSSGTRYRCTGERGTVPRPAPGTRASVLSAHLWGALPQGEGGGAPCRQGILLCLRNTVDGSDVLRVTKIPGVASAGGGDPRAPVYHGGRDRGREVREGESEQTKTYTICMFCPFAILAQGITLSHLT